MTSNPNTRRLLGAALIAALAASGILVFNRQTPAADIKGTEQWQAVDTHPLVHQIGLVGKIEPQETITLTAPFDGNVQAILAEQGQRVESGQVLLRMDPTLLEVQLRDALSAQLKARRTVQEMQDWDSGQLVSRMRRALRTAEMTASNTQRKLVESQTLFQRGIIPRNELNDLQQQAQQQAQDLTAARVEVTQALAQGKGEYRLIADMELTNATVKYEALRTQLAGKEVQAPFSGIIVPAPGGNSPQPGGSSTAPVQVGSKVSQGQVLFGLANIERLKIVARVSELDINQLHQGQPVEVMGDGFEGERLKGSVSIVSSLSLSSDAQGSSAQFPVTLSIPKLTEAQLKRVRLGMSARLTIVTYSNDQAIIVPATAIERTENAMSVTYRPAMDKPPEKVTVTTGQATPEGVEVFGLKAGFVKVIN